MTRLYKFNSVINIEHSRTKLYAKSTDLDYIYGQDEDGVNLTYNIETTELSKSDPKDWGKCGPNYDIEGNSLQVGYHVEEGIKDDQWTEMNPDYRTFLLALVNPRVGGDECVKMFNLYGRTTELKVKKSYIGSLYITDKDGTRRYHPSELIYSLKKKDK